MTKQKRSVKPIAFTTGDDVLVFDPVLWAEKDKATTNAQCYKPATIVGLYRDGKNWVADVFFHHDCRTSRGHFVSGIRFLEKEAS